MKKIIYIILTITIFNNVFSKEIIITESNKDKFLKLGRYIAYYEDKTNKLGLNEILKME